MNGEAVGQTQKEQTGPGVGKQRAINSSTQFDGPKLLYGKYIITATCANSKCDLQPCVCKKGATVKLSRFDDRGECVWEFPAKQVCFGRIGGVRYLAPRKKT